MNKYLEKSCINCEHFAWWDGDYVCTAKFKLLQESPNGEFNKDILMSLRLNKNCLDYNKQTNKKIIDLHTEPFIKFLKENKYEV